MTFLDIKIKIKIMNNKLIIFAAPSGAGKTTIVKSLIDKLSDKVSFSISATSRPMRDGEVDGKDYHFKTIDEFKKLIDNDEFIEWEEVYENNYYGTLKSEIDRAWNNDKSILLDMDVFGAINLKKKYKSKALSIIILPPSIAQLEIRLRERKTETEESLLIRLSKAKTELETTELFDVRIVNDKLNVALDEAEKIVLKFLNG